MDGKLLAEYFETGCFGELALVYNAPRAATVRTTEESDLYSLDVGSFRHVLREQAGARGVPVPLNKPCTSMRFEGERAHLACVKQVPLLKTLDSRKLTALVKSLELIKFKDGAKIIRQGDEGDAFYIIEAGSVTC